MIDLLQGLAFSVEGLLRDADEIEACGGGNEAAQMRWAAAEITRLRTQSRADLAQSATDAAVRAALEPDAPAAPDPRVAALVEALRHAKANMPHPDQMIDDALAAMEAPHE